MGRLALGEEEEERQEGDEQQEATCDTSSGRVKALECVGGQRDGKGDSEPHPSSEEVAKLSWRQ